MSQVVGQRLIQLLVVGVCFVLLMVSPARSDSVAGEPVTQKNAYRRPCDWQLS